MLYRTKSATPLLFGSGRHKTPLMKTYYPERISFGAGEEYLRIRSTELDFTNCLLLFVEARQGTHYLGEDDIAISTLKNLTFYLMCVGEMFFWTPATELVLVSSLEEENGTKETV